ncbi:MAG: hypothetical protein ACRDRA_03200 [Pseudonocardiaceae bacterium]
MSVSATSLTVTGGFVPLAAGGHVGVVDPAAVGFVLIGLGVGIRDVAIRDVAMNVEGADVERRLGRSLTPRLPAAFSLGTVAGLAWGWFRWLSVCR